MIGLVAVCAFGFVALSFAQSPCMTEMAAPAPAAAPEAVAAPMVEAVPAVEAVATPVEAVAAPVEAEAETMADPAAEEVPVEAETDVPVIPEEE